MGRGLNFRLLYRVVFFSFCLIFACYYHSGDSSRHDGKKDKIQPNKLKDKFKSLNVDTFIKQDESVSSARKNSEQIGGRVSWKTIGLSKMVKKDGYLEYEKREEKAEKNDEFKAKQPLNVDASLEQDERFPNLTQHEKQIERRKTRKKTDLSKMVIEGSATKILQNSPVLAFSLPSSEVNVPSKKSTIISHSSEWQNDGGKNIYSLKNQSFHRNDLRKRAKRKAFASITTQHLRNKRQIGPISESSTECANFTFTIKHKDIYRVWNNFSMMYQSRMYHYNDYRVTDDGLQVCDSSDTLVKQRWRNLIAREKEVLASKHCNVSVDAFYYSNYTLYSNFTVFFEPTEQSFTRLDYGVILGHFAICSAKLSLSCNHYLVKVKYGDEHNVFKNFSLFYNNKMYDYREYRIRNEALEMCASNDARIQNIWKTRNSWEKNKDGIKCNGSVNKLPKEKYYTVNEQLTVYFAITNQYFRGDDYGVKNSELTICQKKLKPKSTEYTQEDLLICKNSTINIKYDEEYKVRIDFSIFYKNKVYDYTEYRVLNDDIKICNSTDNYVRDIWKLRNKWVKARIHENSCNKPIKNSWLYQEYYTLTKQFTLYDAVTSQYFTRNKYGVDDGRPFTCKEKFRPDSSTEYTLEDLLMCNDSIINIKYDDEYKVQTDFSILHKNKVYDHIEYRVLNDGIKICNSTDNYVRNIWKLRNRWVKKRMHHKICNQPIKEFWLYRKYCTVDKHFTLYYIRTNQFFTRSSYGVEDGKVYVCRENVKPTSREYTQEDLLMCNDSFINIKYDDEYKVQTDFSILYKNKMYDYTEHRVLSDSIKICNSTDNYVKNIYKLRTKFVKAKIHEKSCNKPDKESWLYRRYYSVNKQFTVYHAPTSQYFTRNEYGIEDDEPFACKEKFRAKSTEYTQEDLLMCNDSIINIKYDDEYKVQTDFSILYKNKVYDHTDYRVLNDSIKICNSTDNYVRNIWKLRDRWVKRRIHHKTCNQPIKEFWLYRKYCTVDKHFTLYYIRTNQFFTRSSYGVEDGKVYVCRENVKPTSKKYTQEDLLMCNDSITNIKYDEKYKVQTDFSILYKNKMYDYTEHRVLSDGIKICNSTDNYVRNIYKLRTKFVKAKIHEKSCNNADEDSWLYRRYYSVNKQFTVYHAPTSQYFTRNEYGIEDAEPFACKEKFRAESTEYTQEDLLMCNDSIINIKYDDEYKVRSDFSILYKNKVYDYTEYRALHDGIKICNSADNYVRNIWKLRNEWVQKRIHKKSCNKPDKESWLYRKYYSVNKQFTVYHAPTSQYFTRNEYGVEDNEPFACKEKFRAESTEYTQEDLLMCNDSIINIKYNDEYKVRSDFSILYKNKVYDYTEYRALNDDIKICNSTDNYVRYMWKVRNKWIKERMHDKSCSSPNSIWWINQRFYIVTKQLTVYYAPTSQYFGRNEYGVEDGKAHTCDKQFRPKSSEYTKEDLLMCNDSIINIKYDDEYKVQTNFSILYKNKVYDYTEYRVLNDSIKICNSTDNYVRNIWKVRNKWLKLTIHKKMCNGPIITYWFYPGEHYTVNKQMNIYLAGRGQYFSSDDYGIEDETIYICQKKLKLISREYTPEDLLMCKDSIINIKYDYEYKVRSNFSILYKNKVYDYTEYRVLNDSIKICNSTDNYVRNIWKLRNKWVKEKMGDSCMKPVIAFGFNPDYYTVNKQFTVYSASDGRYLKRNHYWVQNGQLHICNENKKPLSAEYTQEDLLQCNDSIIDIKYNDKYKVWTNFSILYKNKVYDYTEYRVLNDSIKICNSSDNFVRNIWKIRKKWIKERMQNQSCSTPNRIWWMNQRYYTVTKQFAVYLAPTRQYFGRNEYGVEDSKPYVCDKKLGSESTEYTEKDLLMCNDSIINIKYDYEYKVQNNSSILYKNNVYDYTEYRALNDGIKICNSTDNYVRNIWKVRNKWVKERMHDESCSNPNIMSRMNQTYYYVNKQFTVYFATTSQYFTRNEYGVEDGKPHTCDEKLRPKSSEYTKEDLLMCNDSIINIKYDDEYKVQTNFSILYKNKMYGYTEYRVMNDSIKICNSTNGDVRNIWKVLNKWLKMTIHQKSCNEPNITYWFYPGEHYTVNKQMSIYLAGRGQYFTSDDYGIEDETIYICREKLKPLSREYTQEDLLMCNDSIINIKYDDEYKVQTDFSILYKNKVYDYTEYRVLNDSIKICNSTDNYVKIFWKKRNQQVKERMRDSCMKPVIAFWFKPDYYAVNKQFTVYLASDGRYLKRNHYWVENGQLKICDENNKPTSSEYTQEDLLMCNDSIINIKYDDEYKVRTDFSILYKNKVYDYTEYRVLNDSIKICNSTNNYVRNIWKLRNRWVRKTMPRRESCKTAIRTFWLYRNYYTVNKQFTIYLALRRQYFTKSEYVLYDGKPNICEKKYKPVSTEYTQEDLLMCNDSIINIKYDDKYKVQSNFSILYKNKVYDYTEYRVLNDGIKICNSSDSFVRNIWKVRNKWVKETMHEKNCNKSHSLLISQENYVVNEQFTVFLGARGEYFRRNDYGVKEGRPYVCRKNIRSKSSKYTEEDLLMCNDSIINIKYDEEYKVRTDFSILYKNKVHDYTEYRVLNNSVRICNSTDNYVRNIWRVRNKWVKGRMHQKGCNKSIQITWNYEGRYTVINKQFTVYQGPNSQSFARNEYGVEDGQLRVCKESVRPESTEYTQEDLLTCNDSIIDIKYDDEYKVQTDFSILYKNKVYDYTEYRVLNDDIKICNSTDNYIRNIWKLRNKWVKRRLFRKGCNKVSFREYWLNPEYYTVNKKFIVYSAGNGQYFTTHEYGVGDGKLSICYEKIRSESTEYIEEDLLMCNDSIIDIKYDDEYKVWSDFSLLYKTKVYDYTEYRVLNDSIKICNSTDNYVRDIWKARNKWIKARMYRKVCNTKPIREYWLHRGDYIVNKKFIVYSAIYGQYFRRHEYGVDDGKPYTCDDKLRSTLSSEYTEEDLLMCKDSIINIKYDDEYKVHTNFSILYKNKMYDYTEYRVLNGGIKICNSTDNYTQNTWKLRNYLLKATVYEKSCNKPVTFIEFDRWEYTVLENFQIRILATKKMILEYDYAVFEGKLITCMTECANSIVTIKYEDEYRVWNNFSIMYQDRMYPYDEYRITNDSLQVCNSSDRLIQENWRNFIVSEKTTTAFKQCNVSVDGFYSENYTVDTNFTVFFKPTNQNFTRQDYGVILGYFAICSRKLRLSCNDDLVKVKYGEQFVFKNFSLVYKNKIYDYREYRFSHDDLEMCASNDSRVQAIWRTQNSWQKSLQATCDGSHKLNSKYYTVTKQFDVYSADNGQYFKRNDYAVIDGQPYVCDEENPKPIYVISNFRTIIAPLCALAVSIISLLLLLIVYCMLPELRTLPGLNLMSFSFALLLWQTYLVVFLSLYSRVGKLFEIPCDRLFVVNKFMTYSIIMNAAVNIYHLRKTFCGNALMKSDEQKTWKQFLKYSFFSWGVPIIITIVYIVLVKKNVLRFDQSIASVENDVQSKFYQRIVSVKQDATKNNIGIYHRIASLKGNVPQSEWRLNQSIDTVPDDPQSKSNESEVLEKEDDAKIYEPIVSLKKDVQLSLKFYERIVFANGDGTEDDARIYQQITGDCINGRITPSWSAVVDVYGLQGCLLLYIIGMFIFTAYRIRQKLKASSNFAEKSNIVKRGKFVILPKLSTTTALSYWFPLFISSIVDFDFDAKIALYTVTLLTGAYIGIAFAFTRRNHQLIKKKYFPAKTNKPGAKDVPLNRL